jgi:hypothetical protein
MNYKVLGKRHSRPNQVLFSICVNRLRKATRNPIIIASVLVEIQTEHLPNINTAISAFSACYVLTTKFINNPSDIANVSRGKFTYK